MSLLRLVYKEPGLPLGLPARPASLPPSLICSQGSRLLLVGCILERPMWQRKNISYLRSWGTLAAHSHQNELQSRFFCPGSVEMTQDPDDILTAALGEILGPRYLATCTWMAGPQTPYQVINVVLGPLVWGKHSGKTEMGSQLLGFGPTPLSWGRKSSGARKY